MILDLRIAISDFVLDNQRLYEGLSYLIKSIKSV